MVSHFISYQKQPFWVLFEVVKKSKKGPKMGFLNSLTFGPHLRHCFWTLFTTFWKVLKSWFQVISSGAFKAFLGQTSYAKGLWKPCNFAFGPIFSVFLTLFHFLVPFDILVNHFFTIYDNLMLKHFPQWFLTFWTFEFCCFLMPFFNAFLTFFEVLVSSCFDVFLKVFLRFGKSGEGSWM